MRAWGLTVVAVLAGWAYLIFGSFLAPVALLAVGLGVWLGVRRRWAPFAVLVASPLGCSAALAATSYALGSGRLLTIGYPHVELANVGRTTRLQSVSSGCMVSGGEWMMQLPNNAVLAALPFVLGPMRGTYDGPYPTDAEVDATLLTARPVSPPDLASGRLLVDGREMRLPPGSGKKLVDALAEREGSGESAAKAAIWKDRVLLLRFQFPDRADERPLDALVDIDSGKIIAYRGAGLDRRLPRQWTE